MQVRAGHTCQSVIVRLEMWGSVPALLSSCKVAGSSLQVGQMGQQEDEVRGEMRHAQPGAQPTTDIPPTLV